MVRVYVSLPKWLVVTLDEYAEVLEKSRNDVVKDVLAFGVKDYGEYLDLKGKLIGKSVSESEDESEDEEEDGSEAEDEEDDEEEGE